MAWSGEFIDLCDSRTRQPVYIVEALPASASEGWDFGRAWKACSHRGYGVSPTVSRVRIRPPTLNPVGWTTTMGGYTVELQGSDALATIKRGHVMVLRMGFAGWGEEKFQTIALGRLQGASVNGATLILSVDGPDSLFVTRQSSDADRTKYFQAGAATTVGSYYSGSGTSLTLTSASGFSRQTGGTGVVRVSPNTGDDFYLTWTGVSGNVLTVDDAHRFGTIRDEADAGNAVTECAYVYGHPHTMIRKVLTSTGGGTNGSYDSLPKTWGVGLPEEYLSADIGEWKNRYEPGSGAVVDFDYVVDPNITVTATIKRDRYGVPYVARESSLPEDTGSALDMIRTLNTVGVWTTMRQGQVTVRNVLPGTRYTLSSYVTETIRDDDVGEVIAIEPWDARVPSCYRAVEVTDGTATATYERTEDPAYLPAQGLLTIDVSRFIWKTGSTRTDIFTMIAEWVGTWATQMPGVVRLRIRRWKAAGLTLGDVVSLDLSKGGVNFDAIPGVVTAINVFDGSSSTVEIMFPEGEVSGAVS